MGKVLFMRKGETHTVPFACDPVFANNDWSTIIEACQKNKVPDTWAVGDQKAMTINGKDYAIGIIGKHHDIYSDGSGTAPLTLRMLQTYSQTYVINGSADNTTGWTNCSMRTAYFPTNFLPYMPYEVRTSIKEVNKLTSAGGQSSTIVTTADKLFFLSEVERYNTTSYSFVGEGKQYAYYAAGNYYPADTGPTWLRSPYKANSQYWCYESLYNVYDKSYVSAYDANYNQYVAFAFCF